LILENEGHRLVLVSLDNVGFYGGVVEPLRKEILDGCHLQPEELFLCAIHTHSAPTLTFDAETGAPSNVEYTKTLQRKLVELVRRALNRLEPAQAGVGSGSSPVGANRREVVQDIAGKTKVLLGRNPDVMTDREVQVLKLARPGQEQLIGLLFAFATHSTSLGGKNYLISGDLHGIAEQFLENYYGPDIVAPGFAGASGNIDPWVRVLPGFRTNNGWIPEPVLLATMLAEEVARVAEGATKPLTNFAIRTALRTIELPGKIAGDRQLSAEGTVPFKVTLGRVGEVAFVGWGGEVFNEVGKTVKAGSPFRQTFILTHCNGAAGYVPIRASYAEGGYEVQSSPFGPGAAELLAKETLRLLKDLYGG